MLKVHTVQLQNRAWLQAYMATMAALSYLQCSGQVSTPKLCVDKDVDASLELRKQGNQHVSLGS